MSKRALIFGMEGTGLVLVVLLVTLPFVINWTRSEPVGLYLSLSKATLEEVCLDKEQEEKALALGLPPIRGNCSGGYAPLLKQIYVASSKSPIRFAPEGFYVEGKLLPNTAPLRKSRTGKTLDHMEYGTYTMGVFAISTRDPRGFDSRYFGPVEPWQRIGYAVRVFAF